MEFSQNLCYPAGQLQSAFEEMRLFRLEREKEFLTRRGTGGVETQNNLVPNQ